MTKRKAKGRTKAHVAYRWGVVWADNTFEPEFRTREDADDAVYYARYKRTPMLPGKVVRVQIKELRK